MSCLGQSIAEGRQKKKTWTDNFIYVSEVSANTLQSYMSKSPRQRHERPTFTLDCFFNFLPKFPKQEYKLTHLSYMSFIYFLYHRQTGFLFSDAKIVILFLIETSCRRKLKSANMSFPIMAFLSSCCGTLACSQSLW